HIKTGCYRVGWDSGAGLNEPEALRDPVRPISRIEGFTLKFTRRHDYLHPGWLVLRFAGLVEALPDQCIYAPPPYAPPPACRASRSSSLAVTTVSTWGGSFFGSRVSVD